MLNTRPPCKNSVLHGASTVDGTVEGIQYLRGIAALMVVFHHARHEFGGAMAVVFGARGVEVFFVISGFVMMLTTYRLMGRNDLTIWQRLDLAGNFLKKRLIRIAPLYWVAIFVSILVLRLHPSTLALAKDMLFMPHWSEDSAREIWPTLIPGWTLNYEIFFYALLAGALLFRNHSVLIVTAALAILAAVHPYADQASALAMFYTNSITLNFVVGAVIFFVWRGIKLPKLSIRSSLLFAAPMLFAFAGLGIDPSWAIGLWRPVMAGTIVFCGVVIWQGVQSRPMRLLGDASYSIYLFHPAAFTLGHFVIAGIGLRARGPAEVLANFAIYIGMAVFSGIVIHLYFEKHLIASLSKFGRGRTEKFVGSVSR